MIHSQTIICTGVPPLVRGRAFRTSPVGSSRFAGLKVLHALTQGCDITSEEGHQFCVDNKLFTELCSTLVSAAVEIIEGIIQEK